MCRTLKHLGLTGFLMDYKGKTAIPITTMSQLCTSCLWRKGAREVPAGWRASWRSGSLICRNFTVFDLKNGTNWGYCYACDVLGREAVSRHECVCQWVRMCLQTVHFFWITWLCMHQRKLVPNFITKQGGEEIKSSAFVLTNNCFNHLLLRN